MPSSRGISSPSGTKFYPKKLETLGYHKVKTRSLYLIWAWFGTVTCHQDRQTDKRNYDSYSTRLALRAVARKNKRSFVSSDLRRSIFIRRLRILSSSGAGSSRNWHKSNERSNSELRAANPHTNTHTHDVLHCESKRGLYTFAHNFGRCWRIFEIFPLLNSSRNLQQNDCHIAHHTLYVLLHYLVKWQMSQTVSVLQIFWWIQQWNNFENPSTSAKVMGKSIEVPFLTHSVQLLHCTQHELIPLQTVLLYRTQTTLGSHRLHRRLLCDARLQPLSCENTVRPVRAECMAEMQLRPNRARRCRHNSVNHILLYYIFNHISKNTQ